MIGQNMRSLQERNSMGGRIYRGLRAEYHHFRKVLFFVADLTRVLSYMKWRSGDYEYWSLSAQMIFFYHKLEKGLCMEGDRACFGIDAAKEVLRLMGCWRERAFDELDPIYLGATETLRSYLKRVEFAWPESEQECLNEIKSVIATGGRSEILSTPIIIPEMHSATLEVTNSLFLARRSVRTYKQMAVETKVILQAVQVAQYCPSACNRQPWKVHIYSSRKDIDGLLELQNGNRGFGHAIPTLIAVTADMACFFDASERHQPYVDGGIFAMGLVLALQARGVASCCLNWCVEPAVDKAAHARGRIDDREIIVMFISLGYPADGAVVPRSPRRAIQSVVVSHTEFA